jgi:hypothetical protein
MSTGYVLRRPLTVSAIKRRTGWRPWQSEDGHGLTDGENFVHTSEDEKGRVVTYKCYGLKNDPSGLNPLNAVSEHDPDYAKLLHRHQVPVLRFRPGPEGNLVCEFVLPDSAEGDSQTT